MSENLTITTKYVNKPKPGKKMGSVLDTQGNRYAAYGNILDKMQQNTEYSISIERQQWDNGSEVAVIKGVSQVQRNISHSPDNRNAGSNQPPHSDPAARSIFITGVVGRAMGSGTFTANDIKLLTLAARDAYDTVFGSKQENPFEDDIPGFD